VKTRTVQQPQPDDPNPNTAESRVKTRTVQQPQPDNPNPNTTESMVENAHRTAAAAREP